MIAVSGTVQDGVIVPNEPINWPDGTAVELVPQLSDQEETLVGMTEDEQCGSPEAIQKWLAEWNAIPPLVMTPEEEAEWIQIRNEQRAFDAATAEARQEKVRKAME